MSSIFRQKVSAKTYREMVLEAKRFGAKEALEAGIVDALGALDEVMEFIKERKLVVKPNTGVYGLLKREMFRETLGYLEKFDEGETRDTETLKKEDARKKDGEAKVAEWERNSQKAKL